MTMFYWSNFNFQGLTCRFRTQIKLKILTLIYYLYKQSEKTKTHGFGEKNILLIQWRREREREGRTRRGKWFEGKFVIMRMVCWSSLEASQIKLKILTLIYYLYIYIYIYIYERSEKTKLTVLVRTTSSWSSGLEREKMGRDDTRGGKWFEFYTIFGVSGLNI